MLTLEKLQETLEDINRIYFRLKDLPNICWSRGRIKSHYRRLTLGTYDIQKNEIRIHPLFQKRILEGFVLRYVIYHELLHYEDRYQLKKRNRGTRVHHRDFYLREKSFPKYEEAKIRIREFMLLGS